VSIDGFPHHDQLLFKGRDDAQGILMRPNGTKAPDGLFYESRPNLKAYAQGELIQDRGDFLDDLYGGLGDLVLGEVIHLLASRYCFAAACALGCCVGASAVALVVE
jgi:hypothetical protein